MMLRKSIERLRNSEVAVQSPILAEKLTCYAGILAAEGSLATAMTYLPENTDQVRSTFFNPTTKPNKNTVAPFGLLLILRMQQGVRPLAATFFQKLLQI